MKWLSSLIVALMISIPATASMPLPKLWNCIQIGLLNNMSALIVSDIKNGSKNPGKHYKSREKAFAEAVEKQWNLQGAYEPLCQDFVSRKEANDYYKYIVKRANKQGLTVYPMEFKWEARVDGTTTKK